MNLLFWFVPGSVAVGEFGRFSLLTSAATSVSINLPVERRPLSIEYPPGETRDGAGHKIKEKLARTILMVNL